VDDSYWWSWYGMWTWMGPITKATVLLMGFMLLCAIYNFVGHVRELHAANVAAKSGKQILSRRGTLNEVISAVRTSDDKLSVPVMLAGLETFKTAPSGVSDAEAVESAERAMERKEAVAHLMARQRLILLDTVANLAPLLGMFATMLAIMGSFRLPQNQLGKVVRSSPAPLFTHLYRRQSDWPWRYLLPSSIATCLVELKSSMRATWR
jgi:biopolymer transport protein ExbB/TolQ